MRTGLGIGLGRRRKRRAAVPADVLTGLLAYYRLAADLLDTSGNGLDLSDGGAGYGFFDGPPISPDGFLDTGSGSVAPGWTLTTASVSAWVRTTGSTMGGSTSGTIAFQTAGDSWLSLGWRRTPSANFSVSAGLSTAGSGSLTNNTWAHLCVTCGGAATKVYLDGAEVATSATVPPAATAITTLFVSATAKADQCHAAVYDRALTAADVAALYNGGAGFDPTA